MQNTINIRSVLTKSKYNDTIKKKIEYLEIQILSISNASLDQTYINENFRFGQDYV